MLSFDASDQRQDYLVWLEHELTAEGRTLFHAPQAMGTLGMDVRRIARMVREIKVDGWIVMAGSRELLEWFAEGKLPVFALFGRRRGLPIAGAGPDKPPVYAEVVGHLAGMGHRRIVLLTRALRRMPVPGASEQAFLDALREAGVEIGPYHLPDWKETVAGFHGRLSSLFEVTPPTALLVDEAQFMIATLQFLARRGLRVPEDVSLVCTDDEPLLGWCLPGISHIRWDRRLVVRRMVGWVGSLSRGEKDERQVLVPAEFVAGGTVWRAAHEHGGDAAGDGGSHLSTSAPCL